MKKILLAVSFLTVSVMATDFGGEIEVGNVMKIGPDKILGIEPVGSMTGETSLRYTGKFGLKFQPTYRTESLAYLYYSKMPDKNSQNSFGIGLKVNFNSGFLFEGFAGQGRQAVSGKSFHMNSNLNDKTYMTGSVQYGDYTAVFNNNTELLEIGLNVGYAFKVFKDYKLTTNLGMIFSSNQLSWTVDGNSMTITVDQFQANTSLGFQF